ncbi:MAG: PIN domain-containing protein [Acidimicrobiia bacterium]|nr:PIN domain-containing protein [Acidimicrobiia bacterium]
MAIETLYLADTSAWHRSQDESISHIWASRLGEDTLGTCAQVRLEILFSARSLRDYEQLATELLSLHQFPCGSEEFDRALEVQRRLAVKSALHHRSVKIADLIIAASAEAASAVLWHYDEDFDRITALTRQPTEWLAPRGTF